MHSAALLSATPQKLDFSGLGQPGSCNVHSPACATELQSPQTHWATSRHQSRLHPSDMTAANAMALSPLQRMSAAAVMHAAELSPQSRDDCFHGAGHGVVGAAAETTAEDAAFGTDTGHSKDSCSGGRGETAAH